MPETILVTGATGYVGGELLQPLSARGHRVRAMTRDPSRKDFPDGVEGVEGDVMQPESLAAALEGVSVAYYLVHSMEGKGGDFAERDRRGATNFGEAAKAAGTKRIIYLGGLGGGDSAHLRSREEVATILAEHAPEFVHVRAAMVIGEGSASFIMLRSLVDRLPAMVTPKWIETRTQPVAIADVVHTMCELSDIDAPPPEVQLGGADVLTYREMMQRYAEVAGKRRRAIVTVPVLTPRLSSLWVGLVTPIESGLARPLVEGLSAEMLVTDPPPPGLNDDPMGFEEAVRAALDQRR